MRSELPSGRAAVVLVFLLAGCSGEVREPPPLGLQRPAAGTEAAAPDTRTLGFGPAGATCGSAAARQEILQRLNALRASGHRCGGRAMPPAPPVQWDTALYSAASGHSLAMAKGNFFDHRSPDGRSVSQRASASNYAWKSVGENIAGGDSTVAGVMQGWLDSADHCRNMLDATFLDVAVACVQQPGTEWGTYWTMVLGRKR